MPKSRRPPSKSRSKKPIRSRRSPSRASQRSKLKPRKAGKPKHSAAKHKAKTKVRSSAPSASPRARPKERAFDALAAMRQGKSLSIAARKAHTSPATVKKYAESALRQEPTRKYRAAKSDRLTRELRFPTETGLIAVPIKGAAEATRVGRYWNAVKRFIDEGVTDGLSEFRGKAVRIGRKRLPFITNLNLLEQLAFAGELEFFELYHATA